MATTHVRRTHTPVYEANVQPVDRQACLHRQTVTVPVQANRCLLQTFEWYVAEGGGIHWKRLEKLVPELASMRRPPRPQEPGKNSSLASKIPKRTTSLAVDAVLNRRFGADRIEIFAAVEVDNDDRTKEISDRYNIKVWIALRVYWYLLLHPPGGSKSDFQPDRDDTVCSSQSVVPITLSRAPLTRQPLVSTETAGDLTTLVAPMVRQKHLSANSESNLPDATVETTTTITPAGVTGATIAGAKTPSHKINGGAIAGGIVGVVIVVGAAVAFWCRFRRRHVPRPMLPTSTSSPLAEQLKVPSLTVTAGGQTVLAIGQPISRSVVETQEELLSKITGRRRRSQGVNGSDRDESGNQNAAGPAVGGSGLETQIRAMAESMALIATHLRMQSLADEQPPVYTTV
ncbi:hypothetical protein GGX14DRAFT_654998 [Mycena pura]|uniref:Transmembrane protein n=1 Tax=Mycena pura TaxID=153505 RepID=A0AAD6V3E8_9AGAR|nr:hypothetical protein GGX14DRAFT_654998 [Mycena pura]